MRDEGIGLLEHPPHDIFLMRAEPYQAVHAGEREVAAVVLARDFVIEVLVVVLCEALLAFFVLPNPILELVADTVGGSVRRVGFLLVDVEFLVVIATVIDFDGLVVEDGVHKFLERDAVRLPFLAAPAETADDNFAVGQTMDGKTFVIA